MFRPRLADRLLCNDITATCALFAMCPDLASLRSNSYLEVPLSSEASDSSLPSATNFGKFQDGALRLHPICVNFAAL